MGWVGRLIRASLPLGTASLVCASGGLSARAQESPSTAPCSLTATASKTEVAVGEPFVVEVTGTGPSGVTWTFPAAVPGETVDLQAVDRKGAPVPPGVMRYSAQAFAVGETQIPALGAKCRLPDGAEVEVRSAPITVRMTSLLPKDPQEQRLADIRGPVALTIGPAFWVAVAGCALLLGAAAWAWWWWRRTGRVGETKSPAPTMAPDVEAREALTRLRGARLVAQGQGRAFYIVLAQIAKRYLERRLGAPVLEMTSSEAVAYLREQEHGRRFAPLVREVMDAADEVKFARGAALTEQAERHLAAVAGIVDSLEAAVRPAAAEQEKVA